MRLTKPGPDSTKGLPTGGQDRRRRSIRHRVIFLLGVFTVVTAGGVGALLWQLRNDAIASGAKLVSALVQVTDEQTSRTLQNVRELLQVTSTRLPTDNPGVANTDQIRVELKQLLADRPFVGAMWIADASGRIIYDSGVGAVGINVSDRAYFRRHRDLADPAFDVGRPLQSLKAGDWYIPATRVVRRPDGSFAGVMVAAVNPHFFDRVWRVENEGTDFAFALFRDDGVLLMRSPFSEKAMGTSLAVLPFFAALRAGAKAGTYQSFSVIDGVQRLQGYRRLSAYHNLVLVVGLSMERVLADWQRMAKVLVIAWMVIAAMVSWCALWLVREWEARHTAEERYRLLFDANPYPMLALDRDTRRFLAINDAAIEKYGWSREEALTMNSDDLYPPEDLPKVRAMRQDYKPDVVRGLAGLRHRTKDGAIIDVEMTMRPIELDGRPGFLATAEDVTARQAAEKARQAAEEQLRQAQKMEALGQLTGGIAHDFNNILSVILANVDVLEDEEIVPAELTDRLGRIGQAVQRASTLTRQLLAYSRKQPLRPQRTDINELVSDIGSLLRRALGEQIEIDSVLAENLWIVNVDRAQLEAALLNLCINARDAMPTGGRLLIETAKTALDQDYVTRNPEAVAGDYVLLAVSDTGAGMTPEVLTKVFEPFFTTKEIGKGTGLGLSMVYGFIKQSSGHIKIYSEPGSGTAVKLYLPRSDGVPEEMAAPQRPQMARGNERILVVEDDANVRAGVVMQLRSLGYDVTEAADGAAAITACESAELPFDVLLTDVVVPGEMNGRDLADTVARRWPATKVVFMSGYTENAIVHHGRLDVGILLLSKPFLKIDLARMIRRALGEPEGPAASIDIEK